MKLLYLCSDFGIDPNGTKGASIHLRAITRAMAERGHEVLLLTPKAGPRQGHPAQPLFGDGSPPAEKTSKRLKRWLASHGYPDAVARELRPLLYNAWIKDRALKALSDDPPRLIIERLSLLSHVGLDLSEALSIPLIVEANAPLAQEARRYRNLQLVTLAQQMERRLLQHADAVVVVSRALADHFIEIGIDRAKLHVVPNGVDPSTFEAVPSRPVCQDDLQLNGAFVVGFVGSLKEWHGVDILVSAFSRLHDQHPGARLLIVGSGPQEQRLRDQARALRVEGLVRFTGAVPHEEVPGFLRAMNVAVAPFRRSRAFYFSPIKLFEYMASGACVVASKLGQMTELIQDGVNGLLFEPDREQDLCRVLQTAIDSPDRAAAMGECARETVRGRYTWSHAAERLSGVMDGVLQTGTVFTDCPVTPTA